MNSPLLVQCALMPYQFEAIHPFLDGNGRVVGGSNPLSCLGIDDRSAEGGI